MTNRDGNNKGHYETKVKARVSLLGNMINEGET